MARKKNKRKRRKPHVREAEGYKVPTADATVADAIEDLQLTAADIKEFNILSKGLTAEQQEKLAKIWTHAKEVRKVMPETRYPADASPLDRVVDAISPRLAMSAVKFCAEVMLEMNRGMDRSWEELEDQVTKHWGMLITDYVPEVKEALSHYPESTDTAEEISEALRDIFGKLVHQYVNVVTGTQGIPHGMNYKARRAMKSLLDAQKDAFREKFGRDPTPEDPIFFDPTKDTPTEASTYDNWQHFIRVASELRLDKAKVYASVMSEVIITEDNIEWISKKERERHAKFYKEAEGLEREQLLHFALNVLDERNTLIDMVNSIPMVTEEDAKNMAASYERHKSRRQILIPMLHLARSRMREAARSIQEMEVLNKSGVREEVVNRYLDAMHGLYSMSSDDAVKPEVRSEASKLWAMLRDSNIFAIPTRLVWAFHQQCHKYAEEHLDEEGLSDEEFAQRVQEYGAKVSMPKRMPFPIIWMAYEYEPGKSEKNFMEREDKITLVGHLVTRNTVVEVGLELEEDGKMGLFYNYLRQNGAWTPDGRKSMWAWIIPTLLDWINDHRTLVLEGRLGPMAKQFRQVGKAMKLKKLTPRPYYTVYMKDTVIVERTARKSIRAVVPRQIEWAHRWSVRGHYMLRVQRGPLPIDHDEELKLKKRNYKIFTTGAVDYDTWKLLEPRGVKPKKADEWMAVLVSWRKDHIKGPEDKPFIPSIRKSGREERC